MYINLMFNGRVEQEGPIVGDTPFGLVEKDVKFARWDIRKSLRREETPWKARRSDLFEGTTNAILLESMWALHTTIAQMEGQGLTSAKILRDLLQGDPNLTDLSPLMQRAPWGLRLSNALHIEQYQRDENGELWSEFVMSRINRALGGTLQRFPRYDGRLSFQIDTPRDVLYFSPESNAHLKDGPQIHIRGNRLKRPNRSGFDTDQRFSFDIDNISKVEVCETEGCARFIKAFPGVELSLTYQQKPVGSTNQIEIETIPTP